MNWVSRIAIVAYCLALVYCAVWIPWRVNIGGKYFRLGYGLLWIGPDVAQNELATPDMPVVVLRIVAVTAIAAALLLVTWKFKKSTDL